MSKIYLANRTFAEWYSFVQIRPVRPVGKTGGALERNVRLVRGERSRGRKMYSYIFLSSKGKGLAAHRSAGFGRKCAVLDKFYIKKNGLFFM